MRILAIDPGYDRIGAAIVEGNASKPKLVFSDCLITKRSMNHSERLLMIRKFIKNIISNYEPSNLAIESLFFSVNQKTALKVAEARGVIISEAAANTIATLELSPNEVKAAVTGYGRSDKKAVSNMVKRLLGVDKKALDDEYDAMAIGITALAVSRTKYQ